MPPKDKLALKPIPIAVVGVIIMVVAGIALSRMGDNGKDQTAKDGNAAESRKSVSNRPGRSDPRDTGPRKSRGKTEEELIDAAELIEAAPSDPSEREAWLTRISRGAKEEWDVIRTRHLTEFDTTEARSALTAELRNIKDPRKRQERLQEWTRERNQARADADAAKSTAEREREKRLLVLMQLQNLWRINNETAKSTRFREEASAIDERLATWVERSAGMPGEEFHTSFTSLRRDLIALQDRRKAAQPPVRRTKPAPPNPKK